MTQERRPSSGSRTREEILDLVASRRINPGQPLLVREIAYLLGFTKQSRAEELEVVRDALARLFNGDFCSVTGPQIAGRELIQFWVINKEVFEDILSKRAKMEKDFVSDACQPERDKYFTQGINRIEESLLSLERLPLTPLDSFLIREGEHHSDLPVSFGMMFFGHQYLRNNRDHLRLASLLHFPPTEEDCRWFVSNHRNIFEAIRGRQTDQAANLIDEQTQRWLEVANR